MKTKSKKNNKILITGGCGFVGVNFVEYLLEKTDWKINVLDNLSTGSLDNLKRVKNFSARRVLFLKGDIRKKNDVEEATRNCDLVVNLAAQTGVIPSQKDPANDARINVLGLVNVLEVSRDNNIRKVIHASSAAPLGESEMPLNEGRVPAPLSPYGASKLAGEGYCSAFAGSFGLNTVVLRFANVYGSYSNLKDSVVQMFIRTIFKGNSVIIYGRGDQTRDLVYVKDICEGIFLGLTKKLSKNFNLIQLGTGKETSVNSLFNLIKKELEMNGCKVKDPIYKPERKGEIKRNYTDISRAKRILSFRPKVDLKNGIAKTIEDFKKSLREKE